jgi:hypothetical protein
MTLLRSEFIAMMSMKFCKASGTTAMDLDAVEGHCGCRRTNGTGRQIFARPTAQRD